MRITIPIDVIRLGSGFIATTELGGIRSRGKRASTPVLAIRNLMALMVDDRDDDAVIGLELAMENTTLGDALALDSGSDGTEEAPF